MECPKTLRFWDLIFERKYYNLIRDRFILSKFLESEGSLSLRSVSKDVAFIDAKIMD